MKKAEFPTGAIRLSAPDAGTKTGKGTSCPVMLLAIIFSLLPLASLLAQQHDPQDTILESVGVDERLGAAIPEDLPFMDESGKRVLLGDYFKREPVLLTLNYYSCPTLCPLIFRNLVAAVHKMDDLALGRDYRIVTVSIDAQESLTLAQEKSRTTHAMLGQPGGEHNWPFLLGTTPSVERLMRSLGVRYTKLQEHNFAHPNVMVVVTPQGRIARYLYGVEPSPRDLKLALLEASSGKIGSSKLLNQALLFCFHYDPVGKKYVLIASRIMTGAMIAVFLLTAGMLVFLWKREKSGPRETQAKRLS